MTQDWLGGRLLVATPVIGDPNFERTVVFLLEHDEAGALGVIVNRPTDLDVSESLPQWQGLVADPPVVFVGGPVEQAAAIGFGRQAPEHPTIVQDPVWSPIVTAADSVGPLASVDLDAHPGGSCGLDVVRIYVGYAGWGPGQLEAELAQQAWIAAPASGSDLWDDQPHQLWATVLRRQGSPVSWLSLYPRDPSGN